MKTIITTFSITILLLSLFMFAFGCFATYKAEEHSYIMSFAAHVYNLDNPQQTIEIERLNWKKHWVLVSMFSVFIGLLGSVSAVGMLKYKKWAWNLLLTLLSMLLLVNLILYLGEIYSYEFERTTYIEIIVYSFLTLTSWLLYRNNYLNNRLK